MSLSLAQLQTLKTELATDPNTYGYGNSDATDKADADLLNEVRSAIQINRKGVAMAEVWSSILTSDYDSLTAPQRQLLDSYSALGTVDFGKDDGSDSAVKANLLVLFPNGTTSNTNLQAIYTRDASRAEQLLGADVSVTPSDVANARKS